MNSFDDDDCWPFDPIPDEEKIERERRDKYPFGHFDKIWMKVPDVKEADIENWSRDPPLPPCARLFGEDKRHRRTNGRKPPVSTAAMVGYRKDNSTLISLNDQLIALFKVEGKVYAIQDSCPHAGGPLSVGDIEELPGAGLCVICPWHQWKIQLKDGNVREPYGREQKGVVYPINITSQGDIYIAFDALSKKFFNLDLHPGVDPPPKVPTSTQNGKPQRVPKSPRFNPCEELWEREVPPYPSLVYMY